MITLSTQFILKKNTERRPKETLFLIMIIICSLFLKACTPSPQKNTEEKSAFQRTKSKVYKFIDTNHPEDAIIYLESELAQEKMYNPAEIKELQFLMVSAYAYKANIRIDTLVPLIEEYKRIRNVETLYKNTKKTDPEELKSFTLLFERQALFLNLISKIPVTPKDKLPFLAHAIRILDDLILNYKTPQYAVYKIILQTIYFKSTSLEYQSMSDNYLILENCNIDLIKTSEVLDIISENLINIYWAHSILYPDLKSKYELQIEEVILTTSKLRSYFFHFNFNQKLYSQELVKIFKKFNFEKLILCENQ